MSNWSSRTERSANSSLWPFQKKVGQEEASASLVNSEASNRSANTAQYRHLIFAEGDRGDAIGQLMLEIVVPIELVPERYRFLIKRLKKGDTVRITKDGKTFRHLAKVPDEKAANYTRLAAEVFLEYIERELPQPPNRDPAAG